MRAHLKSLQSLSAPATGSFHEPLSLPLLRRPLHIRVLRSYAAKCESAALPAVSPSIGVINWSHSALLQCSQPGSNVRNHATARDGHTICTAGERCTLVVVLTFSKACKSPTCLATHWQMSGSSRTHKDLHAAGVQDSPQCGCLQSDVLIGTAAAGEAGASCVRIALSNWGDCSRSYRPQVVVRLT